MDTLFISGAAGYLGQRVAALADWSRIVAGVHRTPCPVAAVESLAFDLAQPQQIVAVLDAVQPQAIIHTAAVTPAVGSAMTEQALWQINVEGTATVARWAADHGVRLVHVSSDAIWGGREAPYTEADPPAPINAYGASKAAAEAVVAALAPQAVWVRTSLIYGSQPPDTHTRMAQEMAAGLRAGVLFTDEYRCPIFVDDLALALLELSTRDDAGPLHVAGPQVLSRYEFGAALLRWAGDDPSDLPAGSAQASGLRRPSRVVVAADRARASLCTRLRSITEVMAQEVYHGGQFPSNQEAG